MARARWLTIRHAMAQPDAPKKRAFYDRAKKKPRPKFFKRSGGQLFVNVAHEDYLTWHAAVNIKRKDLANRRAPHTPLVMDEISPQSGDESPDDDGTPMGRFDRLKCKKLEEDIREKQIKNQTLEIKLRRENHEIIEWNLAEYLFFGYLERLNTDLLKLGEKLTVVIENFVQDGDAGGILKRLKREHTSIIKEIKKAQALDLKNWQKETGADV